MIRASLYVLFVSVLLSYQPIQGQEMLAANSKVVFLGDSITQAGARPDGYVSLVRRAIEAKYPDKKIEIIGAGISGNKVPDLQKRLERDVLSKKPTTVVIYIGINDVWHSQNGRGTPQDVYEAGLRDIISQINDAGANVVLCTPSMIGEKTDGSNPLDSMLEEYASISRSVAKETHSAMHDLRAEFLSYLKSKNTENQPKGILTTDGVHLNAAGNQFVADQMLAALGVTSPDKPAVPTAKDQSMMRHIVLFKFKDDLDQAKIDEVVEAFGQLPKQIEQIVDYEAGTNVSPENLDQGYTHCFVVTFRNAADRDAYLPHPAHKAFVKLIDGKIDQVLVFDFATK